MGSLILLGDSRKNHYPFTFDRNWKKFFSPISDTYFRLNQDHKWPAVLEFPAGKKTPVVISSFSKIRVGEASFSMVAIKGIAPFFWNMFNTFYVNVLILLILSLFLSFFSWFTVYTCTSHETNLLETYNDLYSLDEQKI